MRTANVSESNASCDGRRSGATAPVFLLFHRVGDVNQTGDVLKRDLVKTAFNTEDLQHAGSEILVT
jgi:hypothetical protein